MAFNDQRFTRQTLAFNSGRVTIDGPAYTNGPALFSYASATDAIATVTAADYFADVVYDLAFGDLIFIDASDADGIYLVDAVDRDAAPGCDDRLERLAVGVLRMAAAPGVPAAPATALQVVPSPPASHTVIP